MRLNFVSASLLSVSLTLATSTLALADEALAKSSGCMGCHALDKKLVGPSFKDIVASGRDRATLINSTTQGSKGVYGNMMMPPNSPRLSEGDIAKLVDYILAQ